MHEVVKGFGALLKQGWKPLRTIVIALWDAEEYGLIGSTEYVEDFEEFFDATVVAYLNLGMPFPSCFVNSLDLTSCQILPSPDPSSACSRHLFSRTSCARQPSTCLTLQTRIARFGTRTSTRATTRERSTQKWRLCSMRRRLESTVLTLPERMILASASWAPEAISRRLCSASACQVGIWAWARLRAVQRECNLRVMARKRDQKTDE